MSAAEARAARYVAWCARRWRALAHAALVAAAAYLIAWHLPLRADFSYLLPQDAPAVRDLRALEARVRAPDVVLVLVTAPTPAERAAATADLAAGLAELPRDLVERVVADDGEQRAFVRAHQQLLVPLADLVAARDALARYVRDAKLAANPLYIELDEGAARATADRRELAELRARRQRAEARLARSTAVSADGRVGKLELRCAFRATDPAPGHRLLAALAELRARVAAAHPGVQLGFTGSVVFAVAEHDAIASGIVVSSALTALLVALVLALYFRSARLLALLVATIAVATVLAFGAAAVTVGHLNAATAFLGAVISGNGINYGILLAARYHEEQRAGRAPEPALAAALLGTWRPTAVAALCAAAAYGALAAASFQGFGDFALIGGGGMLVCWVTTYALLPALLLRFARAPGGDRAPRFALALGRGFGAGRPRVVRAVAGALVAAAAVLAVRYVAADPFEYDGKQLRAESAAARDARAWLAVSDGAFGRAYTGRTFIAADRVADVAPIVAALRARERDLPPAQRALGEIDSILDLVPADQAEKLAVLADLRRLLADDALAALSDADRAELRELRPPDALAPIALADLPASLREPLTERDGRVGTLVAIRPADAIDDWNGHDLVRFADAVRRIELPGGRAVTTSGASVIFVDVLAAIAHDTPRITVLAALGIAVVVLLVVGPNRRAAAVLAATTAGALLLVATCALLGLRVNFLNFIALPITLGLGVDYAINVAQRCTRETGSAVLLCSLTTIIGYASLLGGDNLAIRGFGGAALAGEVTCVLTALVLVPALLARGQPPR